MRRLKISGLVVFVCVTALLLVGLQLPLSVSAEATATGAPETRSDEVAEPPVEEAGGPVIEVREATGSAEPVDGVLATLNARPLILDSGTVLERLRDPALAERSFVMDYGFGLTRLTVTNTSGIPGDAFHTAALTFGKQSIGYAHISDYPYGLIFDIRDDRSTEVLTIEPVTETKHAKVTDNHILSNVNVTIDLSNDIPEAKPREPFDVETFTLSVDLTEDPLPEGAPGPDTPRPPDLKRPTEPLDFPDEGTVAKDEEPQKGDLQTISGREVIDVNQLYTPAAVQELGAQSIGAHAREQIQRYNDAYQRSATNIRVRLASATQTVAPEASETDIRAIRDEIAGHDDDGIVVLPTVFRLDVATFRLRSGADVTLVFTETVNDVNDFGGIAYNVGPSSGPNPGNAHTVMHLNTTQAGDVGAFHELTHLQGAGHRYAPTVGNPCRLNTADSTEGYAHGFQWVSVPFLSAMSRSTAHNTSNCPVASNQLVQLSNPDVFDYGLATGTADHDNARAVDFYGDDVGDYRAGHFCRNDWDNYDTFITRHYSRITGKAATTTTINNFRYLMERGHRPVDTVSGMLQATGPTNNMHQILRLYETLMGRPGEIGGSQYWVNFLNSGQDLAWLANWFYTSGEGQAKHAGTTNTEFMTYLYNNGFNRTPEPSGLAYWVSVLDNGLAPRPWVAAFFANHSEARNALYGDIRANSAWATIFNTSITQTEVNYWRSRFDTSQELQDNTLMLLNSSTFAAKVNLATC